ncbi:pro-corazonin-like [Drosophila bipectinata]|uniref:pro-corazonin-like n=1 Tax=Drosophila bipectinata TaxID=42026 RepID=UPI001C89434E|nr:pro-corazonin-like [Drosophila bipectinata]
MRLLLLLLFLFSLSVACLGQTFQYSRGWTNGKRALQSVPSLMANGYIHRSNEFGFTDLRHVPDGKNDLRLEKCLTQLQMSLINRNPEVEWSLNHVDTRPGDINLKSSPKNNNIDNVLYSITNPIRNYQTFEELKTIGRTLPEANVYEKQ